MMLYSSALCQEAFRLRRHAIIPLPPKIDDYHAHNKNNIGQKGAMLAVKFLSNMPLAMTPTMYDVSP